MREKQRSEKQSTFNHDGGTTEPHLSKAIADSYYRFEKRVREVQHQLGLFSTECRQLGRSYALIQAARDLREGLGNILMKFHENAAQLSLLLPEPIHMESNLGSLSYWLEAVAGTFESFRERLSEFREYTDESARIKALMGNFGKDLKYRASCLKAYEGKFDSLLVRHYIHDLVEEIGEDLDNMISTLTIFISYGLPAMQYEQQRTTDVLLNLSTVATFFSAVTATTLQMSVSLQTTPGSVVLSIVNTFWFSSLVLSIGAALNSLLAVTWKRTPYGSRGRRLPFWITVWIHASAPAFLAVSIACFSAGLVLFSYGSAQARYTSIITLAVTVVTSFGFIIISGWFGYEQYIAPLLLPTAPWRNHVFIRAEGFPLSKHHRPKPPYHRRSRTGSLSEHSDGSMDSAASSFNIIPQKIASHLPVSELLNKLNSRSHPGASDQRQSTDLELENTRSLGLMQAGPPQKIQRPWLKGTRLMSSVKSASNAFWKGASMGSTPPLDSNGLHDAARIEKIRPLIPPFRLKFPDSGRTIPYQHGKIQDLEYSPDGQFLATTCYDESTEYSTTVNYATNPTYWFRRQHAYRKISKQVAWSPDGSKLLVRLDHSIEILNPNCGLVSIIKRPHSIESTTWFSSLGILSVERRTIFQFTLEGHILAKYRFKNLLLRDVAVVPNSNLLLVIGRVTHSREEIIPSNSRAEKQFILYDTKSGKPLSCNPILDDVRHIRLANSLSTERDGLDVLLGHKNTPAPKLWTLQPQIRGPHQLRPGTITLQPYSNLTGQGYFVGSRGEMVASIDLDGDIHLWDRESGQQIHRIQAHASNHGLQCFAWCPYPIGSVTFVTAGVNELKIWSMVQPEIEVDSPIEQPSHDLSAVVERGEIFEEASFNDLTH